MQIKNLTNVIDGQIYKGEYIEYENQYTSVYYYGRDSKGEKCKWVIEKAIPYFYVDNVDGLIKDKSEVKRIEYTYPRETYQLRNHYKYTYEADVPFTRRMLIDNLDKELYIEPKVVYFDIETNRNDEIICLSAMTNDDKEFYEEGPNIVSKFIEFIQDYDIITSWTDFDIKILEKYINIPSDICYIDLMMAFKNLWKDPIKNYKLETVAPLVGLEKINIKPMRPEELNKVELWLYNRRDTEILKELDKKYNIINYFASLGSFCGCELSDVFTSTSLIDILVLRELKHRNLVMRTKQFSKREEYEGAYTFVQPGRYENVSVWDFTSLYPSIIISYNISFETLDSSGNLKTSNGICFKEEPKGIIPSLCENLLEERKRLKKLYKETNDVKYDLQQKAIKVCVNAIYGQFAYPNSRIFNSVIAESITAVGRDVIQYVKEELTKLGYNVVYSDTDSLFIANDKDENTKEVIDKIIDSYAKEYNINSYLRMDFEGKWDKAFLKAKKHYILFKEPDIYKIRGLGIVRGDTSQFQKDIEEYIMKSLLDDVKKIDMVKKVSEMISNIEKYDLEYIGFPRGVKKDKVYKVVTQSHRALDYTNKYLGGVDYEDSFLILYIKRTPSNLPDTDVLAIPLDKSKLEGFEIDYDTMVKKSIERVKPFITVSLNDFLEEN